MSGQSETYYQEARQELTSAGTEASKGLSGLLSQTRALSVGPDSSNTVKNQTPTENTSAAKKPDSLPADIVKEGAAILSRLKVEATARLKQFEKVEDAADEAIAKISVNVLGFLKEAVTIASPSLDADGAANEVLFESKDAEGRRIVHATRLEAQLHIIHATPSSFLNDPFSDDYPEWQGVFSAERKTDEIAQDLAKFEELRRAMERFVPEQVDYGTFWARYYFLRHVIEAQEQRRRELLKETQQADKEEEVAWDDEEEADEDKATTPVNVVTHVVETDLPVKPERDVADTKEAKDDNLLKPLEPRKSNEHSVADSDTSYDIISGNTSRAPGSPKEAARKGTGKVAEESDEEDWE